ncbi:carbon-nitrogen hydrolase family protein [Candidatus Nitrospira bockiana]
MRLAFLHLAPVPGDLAHNRRLIETAIETAGRAGAAWILTPELVVCGYAFSREIGTDWILPQPDSWMSRICALAAHWRVTVFLSHPERDPRSMNLHNTVFVIDRSGAILGRHRKINTLRAGSEAWSTPGEQVEPVTVPGFGRVGILICADACSPAIAERLRDQGAAQLVSAAAWAPGFHGPNGEWERCTHATGLPLFVCNRTGADGTLDFTRGESVLVQDGRRLLSLSSERSAIFMVEWDGGACSPPSYETLVL